MRERDGEGERGERGDRDPRGDGERAGTERLGERVCERSRGVGERVRDRDRDRDWSIGDGERDGMAGDFRGSTNASACVVVQ